MDGSTRGSWHDEYRDSAYIFIGGLDPALTEGDVITIFSQFGEVLDIKLPKWTSSSIASQQRRNASTTDPYSPSEERKRQQETEEAQKKLGKRRGFGFLQYQDQRSTVLAVDNLNGAQIVGKTLRVDHVKDYKQLEKDGETGKMREAEERTFNARPQLVGGSQSPQEDHQYSTQEDDIDAEDPMASFLADQAKKGGKANDDDDLDWLLDGEFSAGPSRQDSLKAKTNTGDPSHTRRQRRSPDIRGRSPDGRRDREASPRRHRGRHRDSDSRSQNRDHKHRDGRRGPDRSSTYDRADDDRYESRQRVSVTRQGQPIDYHEQPRKRYRDDEYHEDRRREHEYRSRPERGEPRHRESRSSR